jgi:ThiF family
VASTLGRRYQYGASFVDQGSGIRFEGHHPFERPDLWRVYLNEAEGAYKSYGVEQSLSRRDLEEGVGIPLFFLGFNPAGDAVAGVRFHGPLENRHQTAIMDEMGGSSEIAEIGELIDREVRLGAIEVKGAWSKGEQVVGVRLVQTISRSVTHAMTWLGAEFAIAAIRQELMVIGEPTGARQFGSEAVPYPDERYRTIAVCWRRARTPELSTPEHQLALRREAEELARGVGTGSASPIDPAHTRTHSWRPLIMDGASRSEREVLRILRADPALQIIDRFTELRGQLDGLAPRPDSSVLDESGRWVYYPWRRAIVRLLAPRAFNALRLDRNHNKITADEQVKMRRLRVGVVGASAGHPIAHGLAMEGIVGEVRLADFDALELSNLNRIPASVIDLGVNKAVVAARRIAEVDPYLKVSVETAGITRENLVAFVDDLDLVIEECDSLDMKFLVREVARERQIPVIMETSDRGVLDVERFDLEPDRPLFHGLVGDMDFETLAGLPLAEKSAIVLRMLGAREVSSRSAASFVELGQTVTGWPQLASEVTLGAVSVAAAVRRLGLKGELPSGRVRVDVEELLDDIAPLEVPDAATDLDLPAPEEPPLESDDPITLIVDAARRAPSGGNIQPWRFEADAEEIRFFLTPERTTKMDVAHRAGYLGLGAALMNARVAAASVAKLGALRLFPSGTRSNHVATLELGTQRDFQLAPLLGAVATRTSNRRPGTPQEIEPQVLAGFARGVEREGARLRMVTDRERIAEAGQILAESDRLRFLLPELHNEMMGELRWPGVDALDEGLDVRTLEIDPMGTALLEVLSRPEVMGHIADWRGGQNLGLRTKAIIASSSALAAVTVPRPDPAWFVRGGAALERFWLESDVVGLAIQPVSPVFLFAQDEEELLDLAGERHVEEMANLHWRFRKFWQLEDTEAFVMVVRVSHAPRPSVRSVRIPLSEVLSREQPENNTSTTRVWDAPPFDQYSTTHKN